MRGRTDPRGPGVSRRAVRAPAAVRVRSPRTTHPTASPAASARRPPAIIGSDSTCPMVDAREQEAEMRVRLAEQLADQPRHAVAGQERAGDEARAARGWRGARPAPSAARTAPSPPARPGRAGSDGAAPARHAGTPWPRARRVTRPHSSPLMKFASRPKNSPIGTTAVVRSAKASMSSPCAPREQDDGEDHARAAPPWKLMPPCQTARISSGCSEVVAGPVEQHVAEPPAEDDAERDPGDEVVHLLRRRRHRRAARTSRRASRQPSTMPAM